ncbi:uncharacterized protein METZ01_LOCUS468614 [marine metagenome]|uniref:Uncharacterized protein n=1 Tax=marine metagenome TaxID=408172 RepID=A0A383B7I4_9ZZZZ
MSNIRVARITKVGLVDSGQGVDRGPLP